MTHHHCTACNCITLKSNRCLNDDCSTQWWSQMNNLSVLEYAQRLAQAHNKAMEIKHVH